MAPPIPRRPVPVPARPVVAARPVPRPVAAPSADNPITKASDKEKGETKTVSVRLFPSHQEYLDEAVTIAECDKSEVMKRGLRLLHSALTSHNAVLLLTDEAGVQTTVPLMRNGRPA